jgi:hypothetical protein
MKKLTLVLITSCLLTINGFNQITITTTDMPVVGDVVTQYVDTLFGVDQDAGSAGPNQFWDYSGSFNHYSINTAYVSVASTPYAASYPTANLASTTDSSIYLYQNNSASLVTTEGLAGPIITAGDTTHMNPSQTQHQLPFTYLNNFMDTYKIDYQGDGSVFGVYAFRYVSYGIVYDSTDAYGVLKTPMGTYDVLRVKRWENTTDSIFLKFASAMEPWTLYDNYTNDQLTYQWFANGVKMPVAEVATDATQAPTYFTYNATVGTFGIASENPHQIKVGPNPANEMISIFVPEKSSGADLQFRLYDVNGKEMINKYLQSSTTFSLDISFLDAGVYLYTIQSTNEKFTGKIVKE